MKTNFLMVRKHSIKLNFLISYLCILLVPVIIGSAIYIKSIQIIGNEINTNNSTMLKQIKQNIDSRLNEVEQLSLKMALDPRIKGLLNINDAMEAADRYSVYQIVNDFRSYNIANRFISNFYVYLMSSNLILTPKGTYYKDTFIASNFNSVSLDYTTWYNMVSVPHNRDYLVVPAKYEDNKYENVAIFAQTVPIDKSSTTKATIIIQFDGSTFQQAVENIERAEKGTIIILDKDNHLVFSTQKSELNSFIRYQDLTGDHADININGQQMAVSYIDSEVNSWKYVSVVPLQIFKEKSRFILNLALMGLLLCVLIGAFMVYYFIKWNYNPVDAIMNTIKKKTGITISKDGDEYKVIQNAIYQIMVDRDNVNNRLKLQNDVLRSNFLSRLVKGKVDNHLSIQEACKSYKIDFSTEDFSVMLFYIHDYSNTYLDYNISVISGKQQDTFKLINFVIQNVVEEMVNANHHGYVTEVDELLVCLINFKPEKETDRKQEMLKIAAQSKEFIEKHYNITLSVAVSDIHKTCAGIQNAYQEALEAMEYKIIMGNENIIDYTYIKNMNNINYKYGSITNQEQQLLNCMKFGDFKGAKATLDEIINNNFSQYSMPLDLMKCRMFGLINSMINALDEMSIICDTEILQKLNPVERLLKCKSIRELQNKLNEILDQIEEYMENRNEFDIYNLEDNILEIVKNENSNVDFNVTKISLMLNISAPFLSSFFRKRKGIGLHDYIQKVRLEKAKELMQNTQLTVKGIANKVGFENSDTFIRVFKKHEAITPGKYMEALKK